MCVCLGGCVCVCVCVCGGHTLWGRPCMCVCGVWCVCVVCVEGVEGGVCTP